MGWNVVFALLMLIQIALGAWAIKLMADSERPPAPSDSKAIEPPDSTASDGHHSTESP